MKNNNKNNNKSGDGGSNSHRSNKADKDSRTVITVPAHQYLDPRTKKVVRKSAIVSANTDGDMDSSSSE